MKLNFLNFEKILNKSFLFEKKPHVAVAVSGGPDSMALLYLVNRWVKIHNGLVEAIIINHNIRMNSNNEAIKVSKIIKKLNIKARILNTEPEKVKKKSMTEARDNRYELLTQYCKRRNIINLFLAHHKDDNLETFVNRKVTGSNFDGLGAMSNKIIKDNILVIRPLLNFSKKQIYLFNLKYNIKFIEDPSNKNYNYTRPIIRNYLNTLNYKNKRKIIDDFELIKKYMPRYKNMIFELLIKNIQYLDDKNILFNYNVFVEIDDLISERIIMKIYSYLSNKFANIRSSKTNLLIDSIKKTDFKTFNLQGMLVKKTEDCLLFSLK